jgi:hypothetical protein
MNEVKKIYNQSKINFQKSESLNRKKENPNINLITVQTILSGLKINNLQVIEGIKNIKELKVKIDENKKLLLDNNELDSSTNELIQKLDISLQEMNLFQTTIQEYIRDAKEKEEELKLIQSEMTYENIIKKNLEGSTIFSTKERISRNNTTILQNYFKKPGYLTLLNNIYFQLKNISSYYFNLLNLILIKTTSVFSESDKNNRISQSTYNKTVDNLKIWKSPTDGD